MKIGILTQPLHNNYGGLLQNYALQQVLKGIGHEVETLDWNAKYSKLRTWLVEGKQIMLHYVNKQVEVPRYNPTNAELDIISQHTHKFIEKHLTLCPEKAEVHKDLREIANRRQYDAIVVGSDQVWRPSYNPWLSAMFLDFTEGLIVKRVAYAASFGTSVWEFAPAMTKKCARLIRRFNLVTVREKSGVNLCRDNLGVTATHVLDPTLLLNKEDYICLVKENQESVSEGTLFYYILDPNDEKNALINSVATEMGVKPFTIMPRCQAENRTKWDVKNRIEDCVFPGVTKWLRGFMDAEMVIVDSFHGAVFSIIFNKPFWVLANAKRGNARFESLLEMFGLEDRMIAVGESVDWSAPIAWDRVNEIRKAYAQRDIELLLNTFS